MPNYQLTLNANPKCQHNEEACLVDPEHASRLPGEGQMVTSKQRPARSRPCQVSPWQLDTEIPALLHTFETLLQLSVYQALPANSSVHAASVPVSVRVLGVKQAVL